MARRVPLFALAVLGAVVGTACRDGNGQSRPNQPVPGQTDYVTEGPAGLGGSGAPGPSGNGGTGGSGSGIGGSGGSGVFAPSDYVPGAAGADDGDIFRVQDNLLFHLHAYRGFLVYDLGDPAQPRAIAQLPVLGHPVEMFVSGNTVHALLRDVRSLDQVGNVFQYERRQGSRLVTIDVADPARPRVLGTLDIVGHVYDGSTRRIQNILYTVTSQPWVREPMWWKDPDRVKDQAWVVALDIRDPARPVERSRLPLFQVDSLVEPENPGGQWRSRFFAGLVVAARDDALVVAQNWRNIQYSRDASVIGSDGLPFLVCDDRQEAIVSVVDIGRPDGTPVERARFQTSGLLTASSRMALASGATADSQAFFGLVSEEIKQRPDGLCTSDVEFRNRLEAWSLGPDGPRRLDALEFGGTQAAVAGAALDLPGKRAYAVTGKRGDPLFAFNLAEPTDLKLLSQTPGLSGDIGQFHLVDSGRFLLAVGREPPDRCPAQQGLATDGRPGVTLIDVRDPTAIAPVQRRCLDALATAWGGTVDDGRTIQEVSEQPSDGDLNLLSVPITVYRPLEGSPGASRARSAIGLITWDPAKADPAPAPVERQVIESLSLVVLPEGPIGRTVLFRHQPPGAAPSRRMLLNASPTHLSLVDLQDLRAPRLQSSTEVTAHHQQSFRFGEHLVAQVQLRPERARSGSCEETFEFRVQRGGGDREDNPVVARIEMAGVQRVLAHGNNLVLFVNRIAGDTGQQVTTDVQVVDLRDPSRPRLAGKLTLPLPLSCRWPQERHFAVTAHGLAFLTWGLAGHQTGLLHLDLRDPDAPKLSEQELPSRGRQTELGWQPEATDPTLVADLMEPGGFYLSDQKEDGTFTTQPGGLKWTRYRYFVQRWQPGDAGWTIGPEINVPGRLHRTWGAADGSRLLLSESAEYLPLERTAHQLTTQSRLSLTRQESLPSGQVVARLLDSHLIVDRQLSSLVLEGDRLMVSAHLPATLSASAMGWQQTSDRLLVFDLAGDKLRLVHDQPSHLRDLTLLGSHLGKLLVNASGDGILAVDLATPASPRTVGFLPTGDSGGRVEFLDTAAYISAGYRGLLRLDLAGM